MASGPGRVTARMTDAQVALLRAHGIKHATTRDEVLFCEGDRTYDFLVILAGSVAVVDGYGRAERELAVGLPGDFLAELNLLTGERVYTTAVVREPGVVLAVPVAELRTLLGTHPDLGDLVVPVLMARRRWLEERQAGFELIGSRYSPDTGRLREFASRNRLAHSFVDLDRDPAAARMLQDLGASPTQSPVVLLRGGEPLLNPSDAQLASAVGLTAAPDAEALLDLLVVGAGPAGLAAAVGAASEGLRVAVLDSVGTGGQIGTTSRIENYLGFPVGISGAEFATRAVVQAQRFGATMIVPATASGHRVEGGCQIVAARDRPELTSRSLIVATGVQYKRLPVAGIDRFEGTSVFYTPLAAGNRLEDHEPVIVVGDGNSAGQASTWLADAEHHVTMVFRRADLSRTMSAYLIDRIDRTANIDLLPFSEVVDIRGATRLDGVLVADHRTGLRRSVDAGAMFVMIGAQPQTGWLADSVRMDDAGYILTGDALGTAIRDIEPWLRLGRSPYPLETSQPGVFAAGDVRANSLKRVGSAVGDGSLSARLVHDWLDISRGPQPAFL
jgi:thioredoxin reductase (NADPH)